MRPLQVHVPPTGPRRMQIGSRPDPELRHLRRIHFSKHDRSLTTLGRRTMFFREIRMEAPSPAQMLAFYGDALGLPQAAAGDDEIAVRAGATTLRFRSAPPGTTATYHFALRVGASHFEQAKAWLAARTELVRDGERDEFEWDFWG
ncbi:MAG TPA: hypothetical protein VMN35_05335, partial [Gaiellaceae bacterium]|nr:hypothetical protein [Gaiellaceae bacterium]